MSSDPKARSASPPPPRRDVDEFTRSVHASYLNRWLRHDPAGLEKAAEKAAETKRKKRSSAA